MNDAIFPKSGQKLFKLGYGAMGLAGLFGSHDDDYLIRSVLLSLEQGVNVIDTARNYGRSEELIGKALRRSDAPGPGGTGPIDI